MIYFDKNIKILRVLAGKTQAQIASDIGFKATTWNNWENGVSKPGFDDLVKISKYFDVSLDDLVTERLLEGNLNSFSDFKKNGPKGNLKGNLTGNLNTQNVSNEPEIDYQSKPIKAWMSDFEARLSLIEGHLGLDGHKGQPKK